MNQIPNGKYRAYPQINLPNRQWPNNTITNAPAWCSVDLRDGNQALINPMDMKKKLELFYSLRFSNGAIKLFHRDKVLFFF